MRKILVSFLLVAVSGCSSTNNVDSDNRYSVIHVSDGVRSIPAVVDNPAPDCLKAVNIARLDRAPELQVKVDIENGGNTCK